MNTSNPSPNASLDDVAAPYSQLNPKKMLFQLESKIKFVTLFEGQMLSFFLAGSSIAVASLSDRGVNYPLMLSCSVYFCLTFYLFKVKFPTQLPPWKYFVYAFLDVQANYIFTLSFRYTSITSAMLLDCLSIPTSMILSKILLNAKYTSRHFFGAMLCIVGIITTVFNDVDESLEGHSFRGDILCLSGAIFYGCINVMQEKFVKNNDRFEFLGMLGLFGFVISSIQLLILEYGEIVDSHFSKVSVLYIVMFIFCIFCFYSRASSFLEKADAAMFNLSLLTSDIFGVIFAYFIEKQSLHFIYFISFTIILSGLILYHSSPDVINIHKKVPLKLSESMSSISNNEDAIAPEFTSPVSHRSKGNDSPFPLTPKSSLKYAMI